MKSVQVYRCLPTLRHYLLKNTLKTCIHFRLHSQKMIFFCQRFGLVQLQSEFFESLMPVISE